MIVENIAEFAPKYTQIIFRRHEVLTLTLCIFGYLLGLPHVTQVRLSPNIDMAHTLKSSC